MQKLMPFQGWRLTFLQGIIFAVFLLFSVRMYDLQVLQQADYQLSADENRLQELPLPALRGVIFDRFNQPLALNVPAYNVTIVPGEVPTAEELDIFNRLSALVNVPPTAALAANRNVRSIEEMVAEGAGIAPFREVIIAQDVSRNVAMQILEERITMPGVNIQPVGVRQYPTGALTTQIIGYMGPIPAAEAERLREQGYNPAFDRIGYAGVEFFLEDILGGERGLELREVDVAGEVVEVISLTEPVPGQSVRLTIDTELQQAAETALTNRITRVNADEGRLRTQSGVVIAINPQTGEVLSMVSWPTYDNSRFARNIDAAYYFDILESDFHPLVNHAITSLYAPGSIWKLITAAGVIEEDVIAPETTLFDPGNLLLPNRYAPNDEAAAQNFVCWKRDGHGALNMIGGISQSCDVYFYLVGGGSPDLPESVLRSGGLGINDLFRYATALGIGSELGVELPGEVAGRMRDPDWKRRIYGQNWSTGDTYNASFGQGYITTTPLQLLFSSAALINGGILYQPTIIHSVLDDEGNVLQPFEPHILRTVNLDAHPDPTQPIKLMLVEDMIMKGESSLACLCEPNSQFFNELRCNPETYRNTVNINDDPFTPELREYTVHIPHNYVFNASVCDPLRFNVRYQPAFVGETALQIVEQGMRATVTAGTAQAANLPYVAVAGKTGTAEYCDDVAWQLNLCLPGNWPAHAWFTAYAPYEDPEIMVIAFLYNGGEGSLVALPVVMETIEAYYRLKVEREGQLIIPIMEDVS